MNISFRQYADTLDYLEVLKVTISPKGEYKIPSEKDGRVALINADERTKLRAFLLDFCMRMDCGKMTDEEIAQLRASLADFSKQLECPNPEHATETKADPKPKLKSRAA
jgi:hypothetical protein